MYMWFLSLSLTILILDSKDGRFLFHICFISKLVGRNYRSKSQMEINLWLIFLSKKKDFFYLFINSLIWKHMKNKLFVIGLQLKDNDNNIDDKNLNIIILWTNKWRNEKIWRSKQNKKNLLYNSKTKIWFWVLTLLILQGNQCNLKFSYFKGKFHRNHHR